MVRPAQHGSVKPEEASVTEIARSSGSVVAFIALLSSMYGAGLKPSCPYHRVQVGIRKPSQLRQLAVYRIAMTIGNAHEEPGRLT